MMPAAEYMHSADSLACAAGMTSTPASWMRHWSAFRSWHDAGGESDVQWELPAGATQLFDLPDAVVDPLHASLTKIAADPLLQHLGNFWHFLVYHLDPEIGDNSNSWPMPSAVNGTGVKMLSLAVLVSGTHYAIKNCELHGMGDDITRDSLAFIGQRVREVRDKRNQWGVESLGFLRHYVRAELFRLGRLTFRVSPIPWAFENTIDVEQGDLRIEVHVAGGTKLDRFECAESYRMALGRFPSRHPGQKLVGFTCVSWLLDPTLKQLLPRESNILHFAQPYRVIGPPGDHRQAYDLIFGDPDADPARFVAMHANATRLQRAIADHVAAGGAIHAANGFMPWSIAESYATRS